MSEPGEASLTTRVLTLDDASTLESAELLATELIDELDISGIVRDTEPPLVARNDIVAIGRVLLLLVAQDPESMDLVRDSVDNAGRKQFVIGGDDLIALGTLAVVSLQIWLSRGKKSEKRNLTIEHRADGSEVLKINSEVVFGLSVPLGGLLGGIAEKIQRGSTESAQPLDAAEPEPGPDSMADQ